MSEEAHHDRDIEVATVLGRIDATLKSIDGRMSAVETDLKSVAATVNRWKGATAVLIMLGGVIGWLGNLFIYKGTHS